MVKNKKEKMMVVFDDTDRRQFLKSKFNANNRRKKAIIKERDRQHKEELKEQKREIKRGRKEEIDKLNNLIEQQQKYIEEIEAKKSQTSTFNLKSKDQSVKVTTTFF